MLTPGEIKAIIHLLDDSDEEVMRTAENRLYSEGTEVVSYLEDCWSAETDPAISSRIEEVIHNLQQNELQHEFMVWKDTGGADLLEACILVSRIQYPGMSSDSVTRFVDKIRLDAWMAMYSTQNPLDKVHILNHILFERHGLTGNSDNYHAPDNSFIFRLVESKTSNPITMCNLYSIIAQRLGMPVFGVNLPQHFVLAWCEEEVISKAVPYNSDLFLDRKSFGKVLFYINPFSKGQVFLKKNIDEFLEAIKVKPRQEFFEPCSNVEIVRRMLRNLHFSYGEIQNTQKRIEVENYMRILGMEGEVGEDEN